MGILLMRIAENLMIQVPPNDSRSLMLQFYGHFSIFKVAMTSKFMVSSFDLVLNNSSMHVSFFLPCNP